MTLADPAERMLATKAGTKCQYRKARDLPFELREHCSIYFDEELYDQSLTLLLSLVSAGSAISGPAYVPSPQHLAFAATLVVHPALTTRAKSTDRIQASNTALRLLRCTHDQVGAISAGFEHAFKFTNLTSRHGGRRTSESVSVDDTPVRLNNPLAQESSLWERADDFWHMVGWAFNCSILHAKRWARWQLLLDFFCDVLEDDWAQRSDEVDGLHGSSGYDDARRHVMKSSLLSSFVEQGVRGYAPKRRIIRAIFADGESKSVNEFREIFKSEPKELGKEKDMPKKRQGDVNIDDEAFGDYLDPVEDESSDEEKKEEATPKRRPGRPRRAQQRDNEAATQAHDRAQRGATLDGTLGDVASVALRQRLLHLLLLLALYSPETFVTLNEMYTLMVEFIRPLPLATFQMFITSSISPRFPNEVQATLCELMLQRMIESNAPQAPTSNLDQRKLETYYLPFAANSTAALDNAKVSLLLESLLRSLALKGQLSRGISLSETVQAGIQARVDKLRSTPPKTQKAGKRGGDLEWEWLLESGQRILAVVSEGA